jgi:hypothetical protein
MLGNGPLTVPSIIDTYWAIPGKLLAGEFPGFTLENDLGNLVPRLKCLLDAGVSCFLDLSNRYSGCREAYKKTLPDMVAKAKKEIKYTAIPMPRRQLLRRKTIQSILDLIDRALEEGIIVYIHGYSSHSTEIILGCYYVHCGMSGPDAIQFRMRMVCPIFRTCYLQGDLSYLHDVGPLRW